MLFGGVKEIESVLDFLYADRVLVGVVLKDELLEVQERSLVVDLLSDLNQRTPGVLGGETSALGTLGALDDVLDLENLLEDCGGEDLCEGDPTRVSSRLLPSPAPPRMKKTKTHLLLDRKLDPQPFTMRLRPDESRVNQSNLAQSLELPQTNGEQFPRLHVTDDPLCRRGEVARAALAEVDRGLFWDAVGDVDPGFGRQDISSAL